MERGNHTPNTTAYPDTSSLEAAVAQRIRVGVVGCGFISEIYLHRMSRTFPVLEVKACADRDPERARTAAEAAAARPMSVQELLENDAIDIVVNLTTRQSHAPVTIAALEAGRHVYSEKPLAVNREEAQGILSMAAEKGRRVGCAPDTFLGAGIQTCRRIIDEGYLGQPLGASAHLLVPGQEFWHPEPEFYYQAGGGPLLDMAPYYLTALVYLLGSVRSVTAKAKTSYQEREIHRGPRKGKKIKVEVPTFVTGALEFESGPIASFLASYDVWATEQPHIEIYGTEGTLLVPDPDRFEGPVRISRKRRGWKHMPLHSDYASNHRGIGVADLAHALLSGRPHRASAEMAYHVLDAALSLAESAERGSHVPVESRCRPPSPLPPGLPYGTLDG